MQRYRVNLPLLIGLVVGTFVVIGGGYGLYQFQRTRNADRLLEREQVAREEGNLRKAAGFLSSYLAIRPGNEEAMAKLSLTMVDIAEEPDAEGQDVGRAVQVLETTVRSLPDRDDLRRQLVDFYMEHGGLKQAIDHISQLLNRTPNDPELEGMLSRCYFASGNPKAVDHAFKLVGFDESNKEFDASEAIAPGETGVYARLAQTLRTERLQQELADRVIDQMIEANPESGDAYLARGAYLEGIGETDNAIDDFKKALELDPTNPSIVIANARLAARDERYEEASTLLTEALDENPDSAPLYQVLSEIEIRQGNYDGAIQVVNDGLAAVPEAQSAMLLMQKARFQIQLGKLDEARKTINDMREARLPPAYPEYLTAQLLMREDKAYEAAEVFEKYQTFFANNAMIGPELNNYLGLAREELGQNELALEAYEQALRINSKDRVASAGRQRILGRLGGEGRMTEGQSIYGLLAQELAKPENEQDWEAFDKTAVDYVERMNLSDGMLAVLRAEVEMRRGNYPEARELLMKAYTLEPDNLGVRRAAVKLFAADPEQGPVKALKLLDKVVKDFGDLPILRLERADLLSVINDDNLPEQLFALTEGIDDWETDQKVQLWKGLADKFGRLRKEDERLEALRQVAKLSPGDLASLLELFNIALAAKDDAGMQEAQDSILQLVGGKGNATYLYTEAQRQLLNWRVAGGEGPGLDEAESLVKRALNERSEWHELHNVKAEIALARGDVKGALASFQTAAQLGRQDTTSLFKYIKLLALRGRYQQALDQMEKINRDSRLRFLGRDYTEALLRVGRRDEAIQTAEEYAALAPNNSGVQLWLGRFLSQAVEATDTSGRKLNDTRREELLAKAGTAFEMAVESDKSSSDAWLALVGYYAATKQPVKADDAIREAQLSLVEDQSELVFARCYEMVGRTLDAEALYLQALEQVDDSQRARVARLAAQFYLGPAYRREDQIEKATPLINEILEDAANEVIEASNPHARWARSTAAKLLARGGEYKKLRDAEKLLATNSEDGVLPAEDRMLMAQILSPRPEPVSRQKAALLLEDLGRDQRLSKKAELDLARLYFALGRWEDCRQQMLELIARYQDDQQVRLAYVEMLLQRGGAGEIDDAVRQVKRLREIAPNELSTREMLARVAYEKGQKQQASAALISVLGRDLSKVEEDQLPLVKRIAARLVQFEDYDRARQLYELAAKLGGINEQLGLAQFIGEHISTEEGMDRLESLRQDAPATQVVQRSLAVLRAIESSGNEIGDDQFDRVQKWLDAGLREDPELVNLQLQQAEIYDLRRDYDKAVAAYQKLLERDDVNGPGRAVVLNNLAYLLALAENDSAAIDQAEQYAAEAVDLLGPSSEILDTRAVIAIADKRYRDAIADLKLAVIDRPTASKYFHLATAHSGAGEQKDAAEAWQEALNRGLKRESVSRLEREQFDQLEGQFQTAGG